MTRVQIGLSTGDELADLVRELKSLSSRINVRVKNGLVPFLQARLDKEVAAKLRPYPPRRKRGSPAFVWSHDAARQARARRWYFANYPNGRARTGTLGASWRAQVSYTNDGVLSIAVSNRARYASYVLGGARYKFVQVPGHVTTGWPNLGQVGASVVTGVSVAAEDRLTRLINEEIAKL